jgi:S1-C subfamily serine protease
MYARCIKSRIHPATWAILGTKGKQMAHRGTGFAVDPAGHIVTCWHVTYADTDCKVECDEFYLVQPEFGPTLYKAALVQKDKDRDVALLKIQDQITTHPITIVSKRVPFGRSCCSFGHPLSVTDPASKSMRIFTRAAAGIVSMPFEAARWTGTRQIKLYELDFFTHGGSSGGPVFRRSGDVFAFVSGSQLVDDGAGKKVRSNLSVAIDILEAVEFLKPLNIHPKTRWSLWR